MCAAEIMNEMLFFPSYTRVHIKCEYSMHDYCIMTYNSMITKGFACLPVDDVNGLYASFLY